ncbi:hypothetical protein BKA70DRAFT_118584 [Coprinopsis sp. MPI-PUGE-AT-0042]|nr:hypothetical protein BKA70DRAFT_118584 [Coprinopsis sp. MPI-PUGE-AT-0042]
MSESQGSSRRLTASPDVGVPFDHSRTQDVVQSIVSNRKSWKTLRGGEMVWPPELEAALIEGLENYKPDDSRETRLLGRFPLRNRFISDWIYEKTGKRRTAKQVGSRLQQLRDTCGGKKLINLISPRRPIPARLASSISPNMTQSVPLASDHDSESGSDASSSSTPTTPTEPHATLQNLLYRGVAQSEPNPRSIVYIDLLSSGSKSLEFASSLLDDDELMWSQRGCETVRICPHPRSFAEIDPTITFTSRSPKSGFSQFELYENGELIHSESSELKCLGPLSGSEGFSLYRTSLMPGYWSRLSQVSNLSHYHIDHRVFDSEDDSERRLLFSTVYKFRYPPAALSYNAGCYSPVSDDLDINMPKSNGLDYSTFDNMLSMPSPGDYSGARFEVPSWNAYTSGSYEPSH